MYIIYIIGNCKGRNNMKKIFIVFVIGIFFYSPLEAAVLTGSPHTETQRLTLDQTTLELKIVCGPKLRIRNIGSVPAEEVVWNYTLTGNGILGKVNISDQGAIPEIAAHRAVRIQIQFNQGFGLVNITAKARARNADEVSITVTGMIYWFFFFPSK